MQFLASIWDFLLFMLWVFILFSALIAVFMVIRDLFRDHKLNGWLKAVWVLFLVLLPFLTTLIYLIARGRGMAERANREQIAAKETFDQYVQSVAQVSPSDEIARAKGLLDSGAITEAEYQQLKSQALARG